MNDVMKIIGKQYVPELFEELPREELRAIRDDALYKIAKRNNTVSSDDLFGLIINAFALGIIYGKRRERKKHREGKRRFY